MSVSPAFRVLLGVLATQSGCVMAAAAPPTRADFGTVVMTRNGIPTAGLRASAGAHWASGTTSRDVPFDIGAGVVYERVARSDAPDAGAEFKSSVARDAGQSWGGYLEGSTRLTARHWSRSWVGLRTEIIRDLDSRETRLSATGRLAWELYAGGKGGGADGGSGGMILVAGIGTFAVGGYVESGARYTVEGGSEFLVTGGLTFRIPAFIALAVVAR